jgi:hypothetical protein
MSAVLFWDGTQSFLAVNVPQEVTRKSEVSGANGKGIAVPASEEGCLGSGIIKQRGCRTLCAGN